MLLHNIEEALTYAGERDKAVIYVQSIWPTIQLPAPADFQTLLFMVTLLALVLLSWAARTRRERMGWAISQGAALILLLNVAVPHVPAAIALRGYAPGMVSAVLLNLPLSLWLLSSGQSTAPAPTSS